MKIKKMLFAALAATVMAICFTSCSIFLKKADIILENDVVTSDNSAITLYDLKLCNYKDLKTTVQVFDGSIRTGETVKFHGLDKDNYYVIGGYIKGNNYGPYFFITDKIYLEDDITYSMYDNKDTLSLYYPNSSNTIPTFKTAEKVAIPFEFSKAE